MYVYVCSFVPHADEYNQEMVRLEGGGSPASGRVSIGFNNSWATICDKTWDKKDADVVCRKLGYNESLVATVSSSFGAGESWIWTDTTNCLGEEKALSECPGRLWGYVDGRYCGTHQHDAGVVCKTSAGVFRQIFSMYMHIGTYIFHDS